ncbi:MAG TPA: IS200/IS605 family transposase [Thermomicrobiales bacterium]
MKAAVYIHLAWATWERAPLLIGELERGIHRSVITTCEELKAKVIAIGSTDDHIHLLVQLPSPLSVADLARRAKGASAHLVTHTLAIGSSFKWQSGYGSVSISPRHLAQITHYIANQRQHHANNTTLPLLEQTQQPTNPQQS